MGERLSKGVGDLKSAMAAKNENEMTGECKSDDGTGNVNKPPEDVSEYCLQLISTSFYGQTNVSNEKADETDTKDVLNLGLYLSLINTFLSQFANVEEFTGNEEEYILLLELVAMKRKDISDTVEHCLERLLKDSKRFVKIYHKRGEKSQKLDHKEYWGSRQQLISGKVIADWIDPCVGPLDPIFGVLLQPTTGRVGRGDSTFLHNALFDNTGFMAYHTAVHDGFGYLYKVHNTGPGYDYLDKSFLKDDNPLAGQVSGMQYWKKVLKDVESKVIEVKPKTL